jgi:hypothetical protein
LQAKNENDIVGLRECIRPFCERLLWALMECAAPLSYLVWQAFLSLFPITGFKSAGFDRCAIVMVRQQTWQESNNS